MQLLPEFYTNRMVYNPPSPYCCTTNKLAEACVPFQLMMCTYPPMVGLDKGTIFPELYRPYGMDPEYLIDA